MDVVHEDIRNVCGVANMVTDGALAMSVMVATLQEMRDAREGSRNAPF